MLLINSLTNDPTQQFTLTGIPGVEVGVVLRFMPRIQTWNMDISYASTIIQGVPVLCGPNILRQWRNILPFGIACTNIYKLDPYLLEDFAMANSLLYLLDSTDVANAEARFFG